MCGARSRTLMRGRRLADILVVRPTGSYNPRWSVPPESNQGVVVAAMGEQHAASLKNLLFAGIAVVFSAMAFGAAFFILDGAAIIDDLLGGSVSGSSVSAPERPAQPAASELQLPEEMSEEFALRLWQEQVDSQKMITKLVSGELTELTISRVETSSSEAALSITAVLDDGTKVPGEIAFRRFGDSWYVSHISAVRDGRSMKPDTPLPARDEVDVPLLNTIFSEQDQSRSVIDEYLTGEVYRITMDRVIPGPNTATIEVTMHEGHGTGYARIVAIEQEIDGKPHWFIARFVKTGHDPAEL